MPRVPRHASIDIASVDRRIQKVLRRCVGLSERGAQEASIHLTDWIDELIKYAHFCRTPRSGSDEAVAELLLALVGHAAEHLAAAQVVIFDLPLVDVFEVGAIRGKAKRLQRKKQNAGPTLVRKARGIRKRRRKA